MGVGFNENIVEEIKSRCNIVDVIGRHVILKKTGNNYKGVCPFHNEKTPSFVVSDMKQIFTCFGCGATGDTIEFVQRYHNLDFLGAIERLAGEYGIEMKDHGFQGEGKKSILYEINREAATYYYKCFTEKANVGFDYMQNRGIDTKTLRKFGIGYADEERDSLYRYFMEKGTDVALLLELGLVSQSKEKYYDKYRNRVIFPIINTRGKVIGFGGRALGDDNPKYLNSPESTVFLKKNNLYGLNLTRQEINKENYAILVEGYMDVISLYQHGVRNVSASLGTALTESQAAMLKRYSDHIILAYDADTAGQAAALRGLDILHNAGCKVKVLHISDGKDPDDFIKKNGKDEFVKLIQKALPFADYKINLLKQRLDLSTTEGSVTFLQETAKILKALSPVEADVYIKKIAIETKISEGAIRLEIYGNNNTENNRNSRALPNYHEGREKETESSRSSIGNSLEKNFIKLMLLKSNYIPRIKPFEQVFMNPSAFKIYELILSIYKCDEEIDIQKLEDSLEADEIKLLRDIIENIHLADKEEQVFLDCIASIEGIKTAKRERDIINILSILDDESDKDNIEELTKELMDIQRGKKRKEGR